VWEYGLGIKLLATFALASYLPAWDVRELRLGCRDWVDGLLGGGGWCSNEGGKKHCWFGTIVWKEPHYFYMVICFSSWKLYGRRRALEPCWVQYVHKNERPCIVSFVSHHPNVLKIHIKKSIFVTSWACAVQMY